MFLTNPLIALTSALALSSVSAATPSPNLAVDVRNAPGSSTADTLLALRRSLAGIKRDTVLKNTTTLDKSWNGAILLSIAAQQSTKNNVSLSAGIDITCTTCYIKGQATAQFSVDGSFNASQAIRNFTGEVVQDITNITDQVIESIEDYFPTVLHNLKDGIDLDDFDFPPINATFDVDMPDIPECHLQFQFDDLELYLLIDTVLSAGATYNLNLYSSNTPIGISAGSDMFLGVVFSVDLILSVDAEIDVSSGIHIKLDDGVGLDMSLFGHNVSSITFNGANFEFLPVTVQGAGGLIKAVLRLGVKAGFELSTPSVAIPSFSFNTKASAGVGVSVWADIAEFATNITAAPEGDDAGCALRVEQTYQFGLAAAAGATLAIGAETWGPSPNTNIPIFYTTIADVCAIGKTTTTTVSTTAAVTARADQSLTPTTLTSKVTFTGTACMTTGLVNCPVSSQTTTKVTSTLTYITSVASGVDVTFPQSTGTGVATPVPFGTNRKSIDATSGSPVSYTPPPPKSTSGDPTVSTEHPLGEVGGVDKRLIIGVSVGVGVPVLIGIAVGIFFCQKRRRYASVPKGEPVYLGAPQPYGGSQEAKNRVVTNH
ncbi:uncharacterized protein GGS22DRAFT_187036 [Annulohypoxylon maeteangense]|uniref:uncharacterized protein n=1 Tax=Annulohypoxylon maeteangense TaxID=1927788 RepID=UPI002007D7D2|nr:uncharacterized protein GGS22DRAFT_187036 [Annulohypoxylon maeteangense]KAI0886956.1 hypothetical protein GGS22DRAFT_187036 [Annulohypoxylon maeteangense]